MKKFINIIVLISIVCNSQNKKKEIFVNENFIEISKKEFQEKINNKYYYFYKIENDSLVAYVKVPTEKFGKITQSNYQTVIQSLSNYSNKKIDSTKTIIINYFPSKDDCLGDRNWDWYFKKSTKKFLKEVSKKKDLLQFFIFKDESSVKNFGKHFSYYLDVENTIEKEFFKYHYPCFSYVVLKPNKTYYTKRGEYNINEVLEKL